MKEIKAIIQPFIVEKVISALNEIEGLPGITMSEVKGFGKSKAKNANAHSLLAIFSPLSLRKD